MYKNRHTNGRNNICGYNIASLRVNHIPHLSQRALADKLQMIGIDVDKNAVQRIECGKRFVTDIELRAFAAVFDVTADELLKSE